MSDNYTDFDNLLREAERMNKDKLRGWNRDVNRRLDTADPLEALFAECLTPRPTWIVDANVVLIKERRCITCETVEYHCDGWFTVQHHRTDKHARRLVAGKSPLPLTLRTERQILPPVDICSACAESQIIFEEYQNARSKAGSGEEVCRGSASEVAEGGEAITNQTQGETK